MKYYEIVTDDKNHPDRWLLDDPLTKSGEQIDAHEFTKGRPYVEFEGLYSKCGLPANLPIFHQGRPVAFHLAASDMPVVTGPIARLCEGVAPDQVQCLPVMIDSRIPGYEILNVIRVEDCIDEKHSVFTRYEAKHGRPDLLGQYFMILKLRIDPSRVHGSHIFRLQDWEITLVVSDVMKSSLESINNSGILFEEVG